MVRETGLEPASTYVHMNLNHARLPIPPFPHFDGGQGWIRTTEVCDGRFTVCSLWPLGNLPTDGFSKIRFRLDRQAPALEAARGKELVKGLEPATC